MTNEELCELINAGHSELLDDLVKQNLDFIKATANELFFFRFYGDNIIGLGVDDLVQEGCIKLVQSVASYDASRGNLFLTYAGKNIKNKMKDCIRKAKATLEGHLSYDQKCELMEARINETIRDEEGRSTLADILVDPYAEETSWAAISHYEYVEMYKALYDCSRRNRSFLEYHYGFVDGVFHKNYDSARHFRQSCNRIRHVHGEALTEIRDNFSQYPKGWKL